MSIASVMPSSHLILWLPLLLLPSIFTRIRDFSWFSCLHQMTKILELQLQRQSEYSELISLKIDWFHILVQGTFRSLLQTEMTCTHAWVFRVEMPTVWLVNWEENQEIKIGYISRSWIAGSRGNSIFNFLRNLHTIFHNSCTNLQSHQQYTSFPFSPHSHQQFLTTTILTCVSWYLMAVLLCIPITISVAEYFSYTCHILLVICMSSLQKCL